MTQIDIAALVEDREAGTKGPWVAESGHVQQNGQPYWQVTDGSDAIMQNQFCWCQGDHEANARRIARVPDMEAALIAQDAELKRLTARAEAAEAILADAGALRDAADRVSAWFATEARHLEGPRINGLRMAMVAYDRHMQPAPHAAMKEGR